MNIIIKIALKDVDIAWVNSLSDKECQGIEIQLLGEEVPVIIEQISKINKPIFSIHTDFAETDSMSESESVTIDGVLLKRFDYFSHLCGIAEKFGVKGIVVHAYKDYFGDMESRVILNYLSIVHNLYPNIKLFLENTGEVPHSKRRFNNVLEAREVPSFCAYLNKKLGYSLCYPLLDICHFFEEWCEEVNIPCSYSLRDLFNMYRSEFTPMHFNYGTGDCRDGRHSVNFSSNLGLLENILICLRDEGIDANLILEILEEDYDKRENEKQLLADILRIFDSWQS